MTEQAIITMTIVLGGVWGGFVLLLIYALRRESRKRAVEEGKDTPGNDITAGEKQAESGYDLTPEKEQAKHGND